MTLGEKIEFYRKDMNMSQEELAKKICVAKGTVSNWESGKSVPDGDKLIELSKLFGLSTDYLLGITESDQDEIKLLNKYLRQAGIMKSLEDLTEEELTNAIEFALSTKKIYNKDTN